MRTMEDRGEAVESVPTRRTPSGKRIPKDQPPAPSWHELVQPGEKGDPKKALARAEQILSGVVLIDNTSIVPRATRRLTHGRGRQPGRLHLHRPPRTTHPITQERMRRYRLSKKARDAMAEGFVLDPVPDTYRRSVLMRALKRLQRTAQSAATATTAPADGADATSGRATSNGQEDTQS